MPEQPKPIIITFPNGETASKVVDLIVRKKPIGWSRRSYATYYNEAYARWFQKDVDEMMLDMQPRVYKFDMFPTLKKNSVYARINQSKSYLLDFLDPDKKYEKFFCYVRIRREDSGVALRIDP